MKTGIRRLFNFRYIQNEQLLIYCIVDRQLTGKFGELIKIISYLYIKIVASFSNDQFAMIDYCKWFCANKFMLPFWCRMLNGAMDWCLVAATCWRFQWMLPVQLELNDNDALLDSSTRSTLHTPFHYNVDHYQLQQPLLNYVTFIVTLKYYLRKIKTKNQN